MTNFKKRLITGIATAAVLANAAMPVAFAGTTIEISGNGAGSENWANVSQSSNTSVQQSNTANVNNTVSSNASTGGNDANFNTGGDVHVTTGNASTNTTVSNVLNSNAAEVDCCAAGSTEVKISENGARSDNGVQLNSSTNTTVNQSNYANVTNDVDADAKTGYNEASENTGGDVTIHTGDATANVSVSTMANVNSARVSPTHGGNPSASFWITDNGAGADNYITADLEKYTAVTQNNNADIENDVDADAKTGKNDANFNTAGDVMIDTGDAKVTADVDNSVNFNYADVDCGCTWDVMAKIAGNGAEREMPHSCFMNRCMPQKMADNIITLNLDSAQVVGQVNAADLDNDLGDLDAKTGYNEAGFNGGEDYSDPSVTTGNATVNAGVSNSGNVNSVGDALDWEWPEFPSNVEFSFNFAAMMAFFGMSL